MLNALTGNDNGNFNLHSIHRLANQLLSDIRRLGKVAKLAFLAAADKKSSIEDHKVMFLLNYRTIEQLKLKLTVVSSASTVDGMTWTRRCSSVRNPLQEMRTLSLHSVLA